MGFAFFSPLISNMNFFSPFHFTGNRFGVWRSCLFFDRGPTECDVTMKASDESVLLSCWWHVWFKFVEWIFARSYKAFRRDLGAIHLLTDITFGWVLSNMWKCFSYVFLTDMNFFRLISSRPHVSCSISCGIPSRLTVCIRLVFIPHKSNITNDCDADLHSFSSFVSSDARACFQLKIFFFSSHSVLVWPIIFSFVSNDDGINGVLSCMWPPRFSAVFDN